MSFLKHCQRLLSLNCLRSSSPKRSKKRWVWFSDPDDIYQWGHHHSFLASAIAEVSENRRANQTRKKKWITGSSQRITIPRLSLRQSTGVHQRSACSDSWKRSRLSRYQRSQISVRFWWRRKESRCYQTSPFWSEMVQGQSVGVGESLNLCFF